MLKSAHLRPSDFPLMPWKNGGGTTREIAKDGHEPFRWRLSQASVSKNGPFSLYRGYDRHLVLIKGESLTLRQSHGNVKKLSLFETYAFAGDDPLEAEISAPIEDFNVLCLRGQATASLFVMRGQREEEFQLPLNGSDHFVYAIEGECMLGNPNDKKELLLLGGDLFSLSRSGKKELLNLRIVAESRLTLIWVVIRCLSRFC